MLVERRAIEIGEAEFVGREMRRHPVEDDAEPGFVGGIDQPRKTGRIAEARRGGKETRGLVAPARIEGMLGDGQEFEMGVAHVGGIGHELLGELVIAHEAAIGATAPGPRCTS